MADILFEVRKTRRKLLYASETRQSIINVAQAMLQVNKEYLHTRFNVILQCATNAEETVHISSPQCRTKSTVTVANKSFENVAMLNDCERS
jgi:hypothetical protein